MNYDELELLVLRGELDEVRQKIDESDVNKRASNGENLLHAALSRPAIVTVLIDMGIELNVADYESKTPLHRAVELEHWEVARQLLAAGADPNTVDRHGHPPLNDAIRHANTDMIRTLCEHGAEPERASSEGTPPLEMARNLEYDEIVTVLESYTGPE